MVTQMLPNFKIQEGSRSPACPDGEGIISEPSSLEKTMLNDMLKTDLPKDLPDEPLPE